MAYCQLILLEFKYKYLIISLKQNNNILSYLYFLVQKYKKKLLYKKYWLYFTKKQITRNILRKNNIIDRIDMEIRSQNKKSQKLI